MILVPLIAITLAAQTPPAAPAPATQPAPKPGPCDDAAHRAFDFWVGRWDVRPTGKDVIVAHSLIERLYRGCAIRENWMPIGQPAGGGGSLSSYDSATGGWRQTWVDSSGTRVDFTGGYAAGAMVLAGPWRGIVTPGKEDTVRMTYTRLPGGRVRQLGEVSTDQGKSWTVSFDFTYSPAS